MRDKIRGMRKLSGVILLVAFFFFLMATVLAPVHAQGTNTNGSGTPLLLTPGTNTNFGGNVSVKAIQNYENGVVKSHETGIIVNEEFVRFNTNNFFSYLNNNLVGGSVAYDQATGDQSALRSLSSGVALLYTPPANTQEYVADLMHDSGLNIAQPAYAQGLGFSALSPVLNTWKVFRNIAYFFYVILFLVIGFMIMFRQKIGSQTAVNVQQALPNIVISLLAVTFSYAIAGLLIDAMYLIMFFIVSVFQPYFETSFHLQDVALNTNIFSAAMTIFNTSNAFNSTNTAIQALVTSAVKGGGIVEALGAVASPIAGLTFAVVFAIALVFQIFRLFFELLKTYISIIISIVLSPLALMLGALPGNNAFTSWIKTLVANLMVFPAVLVILILSLMLTNGGLLPKFQNDLSGSGNGGFLPPYLTGSGSAGAVQALLGFGILLILPDIVIQVKKALGGSGGVFEQFANNFTSALDRGFKGGELVPGLGFTNTSKLPFGSGSDIVRKGAIGAATVGGAGLGATLAVAGNVLNKTGVSPRIPVVGERIASSTYRPLRALIRGGLGAGQRASDIGKDPQLFAANRKERDDGTKDYGDV